MNYDRPIVLSIAGFDPTGGAGLLADIKTFEQHEVLGMGILSANTIQTESDFSAVDWIDLKRMKAQMEPIFKAYKIDFLKIGIVENLAVLNELCLFVKSKQPDCKIIWDPVLAASSGMILNTSLFEESNEVDIEGEEWSQKVIERSQKVIERSRDELFEILEMIFLITPNVNEARILGNQSNEMEAAFTLSEKCAVLLKGGHSETHRGIDLLIENNVSIEIRGSKEKMFAKHGSGCILSAAITANLALGRSLKESCELGKEYIENRLKSNSNLLAYHVA